MVLTSLGAYFVGTRGLSLRRGKLRLAIMDALEYLGLAVVFLVGNLVVGVALILGLRTFSGQFISVYWLNDISLAVLSLLQSLVFQCWRRKTR